MNVGAADSGGGAGEHWRGLPRSFRYLSAVLGSGAAGQAAAAVMLMSTACSMLAMTRVIDPAGGVTLGITLMTMAAGLAVAAARRAALGRAFAEGDLPRLPQRFEVAVLAGTPGVAATVVALLFSYGFCGAWLAGAWVVHRRFPQSAHAGLAPIASALLAASLWYLARSLVMQRAAVRVVSLDPAGVLEDVRGTVAQAAGQGTVAELVSVGGLLGGLFLLIAYLSMSVDPRSARLAIKVLGERPLGIPWPVALAGLVLVIGGPVVPLTHVMFGVMGHRLRTRGRASIRPLGFLWYLFWSYDAADARRARIAVACGAVYFGLLLAAWIGYTSWRGI